jgi:hypothetical protein
VTYGEAEYIGDHYSKCAEWSCACHIRAMRERVDDLALKRSCPKWNPCSSKSWDEILEHYKKGEGE